MPGVTNPAEPFFKDGAWGWDLTEWHKLPMVWGYSAPAGEQLYDAASAGGNVTLQGTAVPAGQLWVIETICCTDRDTVTTYNLISCTAAPGTIMLDESVQPAADRYTFWSGRLTLAAGHKVQVVFYGTVLNDRLLVRYSGYKMYIAE